MMKEGPPATICGGRWLRGQFSMLMMDSLLQSASSNGRLCRLGLSFRYRSSRFSSVPVGWREKGRKQVCIYIHMDGCVVVCGGIVPISSGRCCSRFSPKPRYVRLVR